MFLRMGEVLVKADLINKEQLKKALHHQKSKGCRLGTSLVTLGFLQEEILVDFLSKQYGVPSVDLVNHSIEPSVLKLIPVELAQKYMIIPIEKNGNKVRIAMADPSNVYAIDDLKFMTGLNVEPVVATEAAI